MTSEIITLIGILILIGIAIYLFVKPSHPSSKKNGNSGLGNSDAGSLNRRGTKAVDAKQKEKEDLFSIPQVKAVSAAEKEKKERLERLKAKPAENSINGVIEQIRLFDAGFKVKPFLKEAERLFADVLYAFAKGDRQFLKTHLHRNVYQSFEEAINEREEQGELWETQIKTFKIVDVVRAKLENNIVRMHVKFVTNQIATIKDSMGEVMHGDPDVPEEYRDIWIFERDLTANASWKVVYTTSERY